MIEKQLNQALPNAAEDHWFRLTKMLRRWPEKIIKNLNVIKTMNDPAIKNKHKKNEKNHRARPHTWLGPFVLTYVQRRNKSIRFIDWFKLLYINIFSRNKKTHFSQAFFLSRKPLDLSQYHTRSSCENNFITNPETCPEMHVMSICNNGFLTNFVRHFKSRAELVLH